ncbi:hypothetical protein [Mucilaginibacter dorajii]|nr:hypothetical protein [Mucilaginibacter dorajii]MCS3734921.1 hypothetical protein [Mucilaginibacter dorajii]
MKDIIGTLLIMLFCITALSRNKHPDRALPSRPKPKPIKPDRSDGLTN